HEYSLRRGAAFFHFLQPNLYTVASPSAYEKSVMENGWLYPTHLREAYAAGYPALRRAVARLHEQGIRSEDLSHVLDRHPGEIFLDYTHVNEVGDRLVAEAIAARVLAAAERELPAYRRRQ